VSREDHNDNISNDNGCGSKDRISSQSLFEYECCEDQVAEGKHEMIAVLNHLLINTNLMNWIEPTAASRL